MKSHSNYVYSVDEITFIQLQLIPPRNRAIKIQFTDNETTKIESMMVFVLWNRPNPHCTRKLSIIKVMLEIDQRESGMAGRARQLRSYLCIAIGRVYYVSSTALLLFYLAIHSLESQQLLTLPCNKSKALFYLLNNSIWGN